MKYLALYDIKIPANSCNEKLCIYIYNCNKCMYMAITSLAVMIYGM